MSRLRLYDARISDLPRLVGLCADDIPSVANAVNRAQQRLVFAKEVQEGWWGSWAEIVFNVSRSEPYITLPREVARLKSVDVCSWPIAVHNQFFEFLRFGNGRMPKSPCACGSVTAAFSRNNATTFRQMTSAPQTIRAYITDARDVGKRYLLQGLDANSNPIYSTDNSNEVVGEFLTLTSPFIDSPQTILQIDGIQKDVTFGMVRFYQVDPTTGDQVLLLTMQPGEQTASYRRYYFNQLPNNCCNNPNDITQVQVTALAKLELIPAKVDTDWLLIQNLEALICECESVRYSGIDTVTSKQMAAERHTQAIRLLCGELAHYLGINNPAVEIRPFGSARLERLHISMT